MTSFSRASSATEMTEYATQRAVTRNVSLEIIKDTVANPTAVFQQSSGRYLFISNDAAVATDAAGKVITTYPKSLFDDTIKSILKSAK